MEEKRMYHVKIKNEVKEYEAGITYHDIAKEYQKDYEHEIVLNASPARYSEQKEQYLFWKGKILND